MLSANLSLNKISQQAASAVFHYICSTVETALWDHIRAEKNWLQKPTDNNYQINFNVH